jgi:hypothetical protein
MLTELILLFIPFDLHHQISTISAKIVALLMQIFYYYHFGFCRQPIFEITPAALSGVNRP